MVHMGQGDVWSFPYITCWTTSARSGDVNSSLSRTEVTGSSPSARLRGPSRNS